MAPDRLNVSPNYAPIDAPKERNIKGSKEELHTLESVNGCARICNQGDVSVGLSQIIDQFFLMKFSSGPPPIC